ncbi:sulfatase [Saliphagus infecundisoli]|uniref:Sulfatase n=1 Tax=Saliphagus infecundisoli TaxID=1849069 RepID=A0ABD5QAZ6_9EURY|nr:sulfatase [Saliphagus infecundisoli]
MNVLLVSIDSLRRDFLGAYRDTPDVVDYEVKTENLDRFAERATVFDANYAGSLPCMPARREWLAGVREFLWRSWGPIEPFDRTIPQLAREEDIVTQLVTDHYHYFQHGARGYFEDFNGFDFVRGHEYDAWKTAPREPDSELIDQINANSPESQRFLNRAAYARNVEEFDDYSDFFAPKVFSKAVERIEGNSKWDQWFTYVDSFDVHEPFHCPEPYASMYTDEDPEDVDLPVWPYYGRVKEGQSELSKRELDFVRSQFAGKVTMVDEQFGRLLDKLDEEGLWNETMVVVTSDHGYFLGDHGWIGKNDPPVYDVLARTPLMVWHPDSDREGEHVDALTSAVDLYPTILEGLGINAPEWTHGHSHLPVTLGEHDDHRDWALYGYWGATMNVTDGQYTYHHPNRGAEPPLNHSTSMVNPYGWFVPPEVQQEATAGEFLPYTDAPVWRYAPSNQDGPEEHLKVSVQHDEPLLYDTEMDRRQETNIADTDAEKQSEMLNLLVDAMESLEAPQTEFDRLELGRSA